MRPEPTISNLYGPEPSACPSASPIRPPTSSPVPGEARERFEFEASGPDTGQRLDVVLMRHLPGLGRRAIRELCRRNLIRVEGRPAHKGDRLRPGTRISVELPGPDRALPDPDTPVLVRLERSDLVVVEKPAGQPSAALRARSRGSLASALLARYPEMAGIGHGPREPGLLHRLDTQTSGLLVAARSPLAFARLKQGLVDGRWEKRYLAVVEGCPPAESGTIDLALAPDRRHPARVLVARAGSGLGRARPAVTSWQVLEHARGRSLLELVVSRARRHQIRVHLASIGCPIVNDRLYGAPPCPELDARHALHASYLGWPGDEVVGAFSVDSPLPPPLLALLGA